ncbi:pyridoxal phosphate-dependent transferase [Diplogelasinospora grovesii]|uniref:Pyridoxal phosphate-dependent transferase n=1 Tax=Diplogelasinospora grovesii TaxID=303347 RepID=A0AAN6N4U2_9PEZI|nr:pyridoxal phosphate-dependent transferase [Diplogelasinospora grovesii]
MPPPVGSLLWRSLRAYQIYGANTEVGKTVFTTILCKAAAEFWKPEKTTYLKPVSTGPLNEADDYHIGRFTSDVSPHTLFQYDLAVSPHIAAGVSNKFVPSDESLLSKIHAFASERAAQGPGWLFVETAGGVHSPGPMGNTQADMYMPLRLPVVLIGDSKLGGISQTISSYESLKMRGYDVEAVMLFQEDKYQNYLYLTDYFAERHGIPVKSLAAPPERQESIILDRSHMQDYYEVACTDTTTREILEHLDTRHQQRILRLESMAEAAHKQIWYPFTQQKHLPADKITVIDSARGDYFQTLSPAPGAESGQALLNPSFDGSASWWTQGLGHADPQLTLAAAYAAGRYGHVMFAEAVHEPALALAEKLLKGMNNPRLTRVFFSDNGSTGAEVAVKMALRAARLRYGWDTSSKLGILGLKGSYHGDTIGAMDCAEPGTFNEKVEWYEGKGHWLDYPTVVCRDGEWVVELPADLREHLGNGGQKFETLSHVFNVKHREDRGESQKYEAYIVETLKKLQQKGHRFGALMLEPVVLGAGGMMLVDPLFQRTLVSVVRQHPELFGTAECTASEGDETTWTGLPVIFDEVFTGLYRLGRFSAASFLGVHPDISVHAKLLTGGLVPLCTTLASESIFEAFESDDKSDALLHGHSYTAHAVGCQVAIESVGEMQKMDARGDWAWAKKASSTPGAKLTEGEGVWSVWSNEFVDFVSQRQSVDGIWALGSVLAIHMRSEDGAAGYKSNAARDLQAALLRGVEEEGTKWNVHSRVLGNVLYLMTGQKTSEESVRKVQSLLSRALKA